MSVEAQLETARPRPFLRVTSARLAAHGSLRCGEGMPPPSHCSCAPSEPSRQPDRVRLHGCHSADPTVPAAMMLPTRSSSQTAQASTARSVRPRWRCRCAINAATCGADVRAIHPPSGMVPLARTRSSRAMCAADAGDAWRALQSVSCFGLRARPFKASAAHRCPTLFHLR